MKELKETLTSCCYKGLIKRGDVFYASLGDGIGSEQQGVKMVIVLQNNTGNVYSSNTIVAVVTSKSKANLPTHVSIKIEGKLDNVQTTVLLEQIKTISKLRLNYKVGYVDKYQMRNIDRALKKSLSIST